MKNLILGAFSLVVLSHAAPAMAKCELNVSANVDVSQFSGVDENAVKALINDALDYKVTTNNPSAANRLQYSVTLNSSGNKANIVFSYASKETVVQGSSTVTSFREARLDNQVAKRLGAIVPGCDN